MKWFRILLALLLLVGTVLCVAPAVHADGGSEGSADGAASSGGEGTGSGSGSSEGSADGAASSGGGSGGADPAGDPPANPHGSRDPSLNVGILIQGQNPNVAIAVEGENSQVSVGINSNNSTVYLNGRNLNSYRSAGGGYGGGFVGGTLDEWARNNISQVIFPWMEDAAAKLHLTADGLAKLILLVQEHSSKISTFSDWVNGKGEIASLKQDALEERVSTLESQQTAIQAQIAALRDDYNRKLTIMMAVFILVVAGLGSGVVLLWKRKA